MSAPLLELRRLAVSFSTDDGTVKAIDGIDLSLAKGRTLGLVGESGCGKSVTSDRKSTRLNSSHVRTSRMPSSA